MTHQRSRIDRPTPRTMDEAFGYRAELIDTTEYPHKVYDITLIIIGVLAIAFAVVWMLLGN